VRNIIITASLRSKQKISNQGEKIKFRGLNYYNNYSKKSFAKLNQKLYIPVISELKAESIASGLPFHYL
jgi:hypothetical protein